jgi:L-fuconate dehydratase
MRGARYLAPQAPGYNSKIDRDTLGRFRFPDGAAWLGK